MKKLFLLPLAALGALTANATVINGINYTLDETAKTAVVSTAENPYVAPYSGDVVIPETVVNNGTTYTVKSVSMSAFKGSAVTSVVLPNSVEKVDRYAFFDAKQLKSITFGTGVKMICKSSFKDCSSLASVTLPESVDSIGLSAFNGCTALESIKLPSKMRVIAGGLFGGSGLKSISLSDNVYVIDNQAFMNCAALETVEIGSGLKMIYLQAFDNCPAIRSISVSATVPPAFFTANVPGVSLNPFSTSIYDTCELIVPAEALEAYKKADYWKNFKNIKANVSGVRADIDGISYELFADSKTATVVFNENYKGEISIPAKVAYEGVEYAVEAIAAGAFDGLEPLPESR